MTERVEGGVVAKEPTGLHTAAIMTIQLICLGVSAMTPAMSVFQTYFADEPLTAVFPVTSISTMPTLGCMIGTFITGAVVNKVKPRTLAIIAGAIFVFAGVLPTVIYLYPLVLVSRLLVGIGIGLMTPLANIIILGCYKGDRKASLLGYATLLLNIGGLVIQTLAGVLAGVDATGRLVFLCQLWGIPSLIMSFFLPDPDMYEGDEESGVEDADSSDKKVKIPASVWVVGLIFLGFNLFNYPTLLNCSNLLMECGVSSETVSTTAAMVLNCYTIIGMIAGVVYGKIFNKAPQWVLAIGFASAAIGEFMLFFLTSIPAIWIGYIFVGFGFSTFLPASYAWAGEVSTPESRAAGVSAIQILNKLGGFLSTYWMLFCTNVFGESIFAPGYVVTVFMAICTVFFALYNPWRGKENGAAAA